jgi:hypothetical protein
MSVQVWSHKRVHSWRLRDKALTMEKSIERGPDWAALPVIGTLLQPPSSIREAAPEQ